MDLPQPMSVVHDSYPLGLQDLDFHAALVFRTLVAMLLHAVQHGCIDECICLGNPVKQLLDLHGTPDRDEGCGLLLCPVGAPGCCLWHQGSCQGPCGGRGEGQSRASGASIVWHAHSEEGHGAHEADSVNVESWGQSQGLQGPAHAHSTRACSP